MASWIISLFRSIWPLNASNDLSASRKLVQPLPLKPATKHFVFALRDPDNPSSVVYILSTLVLSERSASDARDLVKTVSPRAVVAQVESDAVEIMQMEEEIPTGTAIPGKLPTSLIGVIKESFLDGRDRGKYEKMAGTLVMRSMFGTSLYGHVVAAREAAARSQSAFYYLETPMKQPPPSEEEASKGETNGGQEGSAGEPSKPLTGASQLTNFSCAVSGVPIQAASRRFSPYWDLARVKSLYPYAASSLQEGLAENLSSAGVSVAPAAVEKDLETEFECPPFARSFYPLLVDLHWLWRELPGMNVALQKACKILDDVDKGKTVDHSELAVSQSFRLAVEELRFALNTMARSPLKLDRNTPRSSNFDDLSYEDKCSVLLVQALKQLARKSQTVVAVLDASSITGIRKHWTTSVSREVVSLAEECLVSEEEEDAEHDSEKSNSKGGFLDKPVVVVGAGAAAAVGLASLSHAAPVSTAMKILTFKIPTIVKLGLMQTKRNTVIVMAKLVNPVTKVLLPAAKGIAPSKFFLGSKASSAMKATASTGKIRAAAHSVIGAAERASLSAIRTAFYNVMQKRQGKGALRRSWLVFGGSVAACAGLLAFGDGIENAIEALPEASAIAQLGRGVESLSHALETLKRDEKTDYWESMYGRLYGRWHRS